MEVIKLNLNRSDASFLCIFLATQDKWASRYSPNNAAAGATTTFFLHKTEELPYFFLSNFSSV